MVEIDRNIPRRVRRRPTAWIRPLGYLASIRGVPAFSISVAVLQSSSRPTALVNNRPAFLRRRAAEACGDRGACSALGCSRGKRGTSRDGSWELCSSVGITDESVGEGSEDDDGDGASFFPDTLGPTAPVGVTAESWERVKRSARDKRLEDERLSPSPKHSPRHVATVTIQALGRNDVPYPNHGCEVAIRFSSASNPASGFTPGGMRTYLDDPSMTFYRILGDWDEMGPPGEPDMDDGETRAYQQIRVRRENDPAWSAVNMDLVREEGCWLIERLWVDDKSVAGGRMGEGSESPPRSLTVAELFDEDRLEMMSCKYADYDPARLAAAGGDWLEEHPNISLSPKAVALTCIISLRQNDSTPGSTLRRNEGCERVIRFCSPTNVASTLTPAHFAKYLTDPWYSIFKEWDELAFHSEDISEDGNTADLVVLLRPKEEEAWTSVNWELVKCDGMWLTEKIWVVDV